MKFKKFSLIDKIFEKISEINNRKIKDIEAEIKKAPKYDVDFNVGLSAEQIKERTEHDLVNKYRKTVTKSYLEIIVKNLFSVLNVLLIAVAITLAVFGLWQRLFFVIILTFNIGISLFQDIKARRLVEKLSLISNPRATVVREGVRKEVPFNELLLSDIVILKAGNTIPCDSIVVHGAIRVNESMLTGESDDILKDVGDVIYAESVVTSGNAFVSIQKIGKANYVTQLQDKARTLSRPKSDILKSLTTIIRAISALAIVIGILQIIACVLTKKGITQSVDSIGSSIVGMIPSGMYLMTSITLTVGVIILARHNMLVRELYSIEMLARVDTLCVDKTGTLTDGNMSVRNLVAIGSRSIYEIENIISELLYATKDDNITAKCLKEKYTLKIIKGDYVAIPFTSEKKYSAYSSNHRTYVLGAYGFFDIEHDDEVREKVSQYENEGRRVLIIAESNKNIEHNKLPGGLKAIAILVLSENLKKDAKENIDWFKQNDVGVRIISGDSVSSLKMIAKEVGIEEYDKAISLNKLTDAQVRKAAKENYIFGRVSPEQKKIIIEELRNQGHCVAMVGDGVNDLLALKAADCSIAMASGSDAAKAASHLVSLDSNFSSLPNVVTEGRRVINNLQRVCSIFLVKSGFAMVFALIFAVFSYFDSSISYPFTTNNLMFWELLTIGLAPFFIALEPNKERIKGRFSQNIFKKTVPACITQLLISFPPIIISFYHPDLFPKEGMVAGVVIAFSLMSLIILLHVCLPLNTYRLRVLIFTTILMILAVGLDVFLKLKFNSGILDINYLNMNVGNILFATLMFIVGIPIYFLIAWAFGKWFNKEKEAL